MAAPSKQASSAKTSLVYVTLGSLTVIWTIVYYIYLSRREASDISYLICYGLLATGSVLILIGLAVGQLGRAAMKAEVAPTPDGAAPVVVPTPAAPAAAGVPAAGVPAGVPTGPTPAVTLPRATVAPAAH